MSAKWRPTTTFASEMGVTAEEELNRKVATDAEAKAGAT
jgi:hypothetical protein